jgi:hypothetical protein
MKITIGAAAVAFLLLPTAPVHAASKFYTVDVVQTGLTKIGASSVRLTDRAEVPVFTKKWFTLPNKVRKEMLAISLSAVSAGLPLRVRVDLEETGAPIIKIMYMQSE